jgi:hypothetical protein
VPETPEPLPEVHPLADANCHVVSAAATYRFNARQRLQPSQCRPQ